MATVCDVGCGNGRWLAAALAGGTAEVVGIEGPWISDVPTLDPRESYAIADLEKPLSLNRKFDLVMCLEVVEHLSNGRSKSIVQNLCALGPVVLFSAAIPRQGGLDHINEQLLSFWVEHFRRHGYQLLDFIRPKIWSTQSIPFWYRQNMVVFCDR